MKDLNPITLLLGSESFWTFQAVEVTVAIRGIHCFCLIDVYFPFFSILVFFWKTHFSAVSPQDQDGTDLPPAPGDSSDLALASGMGCGWACDLHCPSRVFPGNCEGTVCKEEFPFPGSCSLGRMCGPAGGLYVGSTCLRVRLTLMRAGPRNRGRDFQGHCSGVWVGPRLWASKWCKPLMSFS